MMVWFGLFSLGCREILDLSVIVVDSREGIVIHPLIFILRGEK